MNFGGSLLGFSGGGGTMISLPGIVKIINQESIKVETVHLPTKAWETAELLRIAFLKQ